MKLTKLFALSAALVVATAGAVAPRAGTSITNQASVDFTVTDPATGKTTQGNSLSNIVSTVVNPVPSFTITPNTGDAALTKNNVPANTATSFTYTITNTGNTPITVNLASANTANTAPTKVTLSETTVTLQPGAETTVTQTYTVGGPATYGQNLVGTGLYDSTPSADGTGDQYTEQFGTDNNNENVAIVAAATTAIPGSPATGGNPSVSPLPTPGTANFPADPNNPDLNNTANPGTTTPATGTGYVQPNGPTVPGGAILPGAGTPIQVSPSGNPTAYPKADSDSTAPTPNAPDVVSMTGTAPNNSGVPDNITVGPATVPDGTGPITVQIINPATGQPFQNGEVPVDINGNPIPGATVTVNPDGSVTFNKVPNGSAPAYTVQITYPDAQPNTNNPAITTTVPITSGNAGGQPIASPTYTVKRPGLDLTVVAQDTNGTLDNSGQTFTPSTTATTNADFASSVTNLGSYSDTFNITSGTNNLPAGATVEYRAADGTLLTDTNGDSIVDVGNVAPGVTVNFTTRVVLPANAVAGTGYSVTDVATGAYSTLEDTDGTLFNVGLVGTPTGGPNDPTNPGYSSNPLFPITKTVNTTAANPGDNLVYKITAVNKYNAPACNVIFKELDGGNTNIFANSTYQTVNAASSKGQMLFSTNGGATWSAAAPAAGTNPASLWIGVDVNTNGTVDATDCLPINGDVTINLTTQVNK